MNEQDVRALVREAIERHLARPERPARVEHYDLGATQAAEYPKAADHPSHVLLKVVAGSDSDDGMCVIEPRVRCNHCGFCQSFGH
jgi:hypothetical protein